MGGETISTIERREESGQNVKATLDEARQNVAQFAQEHKQEGDLGNTGAWGELKKKHQS